MARLNEPAVPAESFEALKRRFTRQNREIARANSTQSLRIRDLEAEVSRLLSENLSLREQIVHLEHEAEKYASQHLLESVDDIAGQLNAKISEFGSLVAELNRVRDARRGRTSRAPKAAQTREERSRQSTMAAQDILSDASGRLTPIVEDKRYPRLSLVASEASSLVSDQVSAETDSPDLGPPPVAHLSVGSTAALAIRPKSALENLADINTTLPPNLEYRRRRRHTMNLAEFRQSQLADPAPPEAEVEPAQSLKSGAKRKLGDRERIADEEVESEKATAEKEDIDLTRRPTRAETRRKSGSDAAAVTSRAKTSRATAAVTGTSGRRALGPKTVNADPTSPLKNAAKANSAAKPPARRVSLKDPKDARKPLSSNARPLTKDRAPPARPSIEPTTSRPALSSTPSPEPATPAQPLDVFSPPSSSAPRNTSRDTPPPAELAPADAVGPAGRAARRQRGQVNYAEPNLRDKMRRPNKVLVDAVTGEGKSKRLSSVRLSEAAVLTAEEEAKKPGARQVTFKKEPDDVGEEDRWKDLPAAI